MFCVHSATLVSTEGFLRMLEEVEKRRLEAGLTARTERPITINLWSLIQIPGNDLGNVTRTASFSTFFPRGHAYPNPSWGNNYYINDNASTGMHFPVIHAER